MERIKIWTPSDGWPKTPELLAELEQASADFLDHKPGHYVVFEDDISNGNGSITVCGRLPSNDVRNYELAPGHQVMSIRQADNDMR